MHKFFILSPLVLFILGCTVVPSQTQYPTVSPTVQATDSIAVATASSVFEKYCGETHGSLFNENWGICERSSYGFTVFNLDGRVWQPSFTDLDIAREGESTEYITRAISWTKDNQNVYLTSFPAGYDPVGPLLLNSTGLFKLNLRTGQIQSVLPPNYWYSVSISPTGKYLAYTMIQRPLTLTIQDLQSGKIEEIDLGENYSQAGDFMWSSDGLKVAYKLIINGDECSRVFSIQFLSINDMKSTTVIDDTNIDTCQPIDPTYYVTAVTDNSVILEQAGNIWVYEISTQQLSLQATATPMP